MAALDQPSGLMEIASSLTQDEIPFKLRCAICNKLAVNAFRLPCCDQAICESCQASLPDTCPVCAHTPLSADLCKPNKALRTTLKAFLRTEEKKREKERQSATPAVANGTTPLEGTPTQPDAPAPPSVPEEKAPEEQTQPASVADGRSEQPLVEATAAEPQPHDAEPGLEAPEGAPARDAHSEALPADAADQAGSAPQDHSGEGDGNEDNSVQPVEQEVPDQTQNPMASNGMGFNMGPGFPNMAWNNAGGFNPMSQPFMGGGMFNFPNAMGMPGMAMDPMAANPGMMGGYGMNMNGMNNGMNMGMSYDAGQGMYGGWDGSQNSMWNGQDKINPNGFATGMGAQYGPSGFGGYNMSQPNGVHAQMHHQQFPPQDFQPGFNGQGYGRGNFRGRGRGFFAGRGRGGFPGSLQANYSYQSHNSPSFNADMASQSHDGISPDVASGDAAMADAKEAEGAGEHVPGSEQDPQQIASSGDVSSGPDGNVAESVPVDVSGDATQMEGDTSQLRGIPTIDSLDEANAQAMGGPMGMNAPMGPGYGRGGYMRGSFPGRGGYGGPFMPQHNMQCPRVVPGVEGAPAAPRAMRQGLPNTSVLRQRPFQGPGRSPISRPAASQSATPTAQDDQQPQLEPRSRSASRGRSPSKPRSRSRSRARSPSYHDRPYRQRSASADRQTDDSERRRERRRREDRREDQPAPDDRRTRSPSVDSRQSTYRRDRGRDRRIDRRSRRHRSPSASRNGDSRDDRLSLIAEEKGTGSRSRTPVTADAESSSRRSGRDRPSRREEDREREKDSRRRDRDRNHERERDRDRDRDRYRERERDRDRERERERERDRDRDRRRARDKERDRDRKRSRRDRSASPADSEYSSRHHSRRVKRSRDDDARPSDRERTKDKPSKTTEPEKDPHTLEREARNRERLLKEQQRREAMHADGGGGGGKSSRRRDSRQDRGLTGGRRLGYKYEDEENDDARAARVESEREASRWA